MKRVFLATSIILTVPFVSRALELTVTPIEPPEGIQKEPVSQPVPVPYLSLAADAEIQKPTSEPTIELGDGDPDLSVRAWLMATGDRLLLYADVTDDVFEQTFWGDDLWQGDSIQIAIDPLHDRTPGRYGHDDHEIGLTLTEKRPLIWRFAAPDRLDRGIISDAELTVVRKGNHTIYTLYLPYSSVEYLCPSVFPYSGFNLVVNDSDTRRQRDGYLAWTTGTADSKNPAGFRTLLWPTERLLHKSRVIEMFRFGAWIERGDPFAPVGTPHHFTLAVRSSNPHLGLPVSARVGEGQAQTEFPVPEGLSWHQLSVTTRGETCAKLSGEFFLMWEPLDEFTIYRYRAK